MSHAATKWAIEQRGIKPAAKIVLWQLCDRFHPDNGCFPSQETLADDCEMSRSSLNNHLDALEARGLIARETRRDPNTKKRESTRYKFPFESDFVPSVTTQNADENIGENAGEPCRDSGHGAESKKEPEPCPENGQSRVQNPDTNLVREPVIEPIEREARAREPEPDPETDQDFQSLLAKVAKAAGPQPIGRCYPLWQRLDDDAMRQAALVGWESCLAEWSKGGRKHPYGLETYLRDRMWAQAPKAEGDVPKVVLSLRSGEWFAAFWSAWIVRDLTTCRKMVMLGKAGSGWAAPASAIPSGDAIGAMPRVALNGHEWSAWRQRLAQDEIRLSVDMTPAWVWVPSEWPQGDFKTARTG